MTFFNLLLQTFTYIFVYVCHDHIIQNSAFCFILYKLQRQQSIAKCDHHILIQSQTMKSSLFWPQHMPPQITADFDCDDRLNLQHVILILCYINLGPGRAQFIQQQTKDWMAKESRFSSGMGKRYFSSTQCPYLLWNPPNLLSKGSSSNVKWPGRETDSSDAKVKNAFTAWRLIN